MDIGRYIKPYLQAQAYWAPQTAKSELSRLKNALPAIDGSPDTLLQWMKKRGLNKHSALKTYLRVSAFVDWLIKEGLYKENNAYKTHLKATPRLFQNAYKRKPATFSMAEASEKIRSLECALTRTKAFQLLFSGMRWGESLTYKNGECSGKTGPRCALIPKEFESFVYPLGYDTFYKKLKKVGLTPHTLRKVFLTHLAIEKKLDPFTLQKVAGWTSLASATSYIAAHDGHVIDVVSSLHKEMMEHVAIKTASGI